MKQTNVKPATGKLGILIVGNGAVSTTFMTGVPLAQLDDYEADEEVD